MSILHIDAYVRHSALMAEIGYPYFIKSITNISNYTMNETKRFQLVC